MGTLRKAFFGIIWSLADTVLIKGSMLFVGILIARIIGPEEYGLFAIVAVFSALGNVIVDSGMSSSLIRSKDNASLDYSSVFIGSVLIGTLVYILSYISAESIANYFGHSKVKSLIQVNGLILIFGSFYSVHSAYLIRNLNFRRATLLNIPGIILGSFTGVILALEGHGVWCLIYMTVVNRFTTMCVYLWRVELRFPIVFSKVTFYSHFSYGYKILLSTVLNKLFIYSYNVVIGRNHPIEMVGNFERASSLSAYTNDTLTGALKKVSFPLLSKIQSDVDKFKRVYRNLMRTSFFVFAPFMVFLILMAESLFTLLLGDEWDSAYRFFQILCVSGILYPNHAFNLNVLKVKGRSDLFLKVEVIKKVMWGILIIMSYNQNIFVFISSSVVVSVLSTYINVYYSNKFICYSFFQQVSDMIYPIAVSIIAGLLAVYFEGFINFNFELLKVIFVGVILSLVYIGASVLMKRKEIKLLIELTKFVK